MYITIGHWRLAARKCLPGIRSVCNCSCARSHAKSKKLGQKCIVMFLTATAAAAATVFSRRCLVEEHLLRRYWPVLRRWCIRIQGALGPPHGTQILVWEQHVPRDEDEEKGFPLGLQRLRTFRDRVVCFVILSSLYPFLVWVEFMMSLLSWATDWKVCADMWLHVSVCWWYSGVYYLLVARADGTPTHTHKRIHKHTRIHTNTHAQTHTHTHADCESRLSIRGETAYTHTLVHAYMKIHKSTFYHPTHMYACIYTCIHIHIHVNKYIFMIHGYTCIYVYVYTIHIYRICM